MKWSRPTLTAAFVLLLAVPAGAQEIGGIRGEMMQDLKEVADKYGSLAEAMPESAYSWRPQEGVRSVSEVFMHVAATNFGIPQMIGVAPPDDVEPQWVDFQNAESITDKATILRALKASFDHLGKTLESTSDADLDNPTQLFGQESTTRGVLLLVSTHCHEHLGQAIAYARVNGVTPPWSEGGN